ncbi:PDZ domain-containing protein [Psychrobium sp. MM17-31]|uniref:PDZ domain-containing protein n=1 Tax=Psychrobium sp. MM17-31 TaxID=2917758 RepID=UPI001EF7090C|nr:PDZ domain-containing protein [Psychrobium sp. MM17-31]MCG7533326.1 PDZ domain-containing protein [Psychrobium sp. MM17-31]
MLRVLILVTSLLFPFYIKGETSCALISFDDTYGKVRVSHINHNAVNSIDDYRFNTGRYLFSGFLGATTNSIPFSIELVISAGYHYKVTLNPTNDPQSPLQLSQSKQSIFHCGQEKTLITSDFDVISTYSNGSELPFPLAYRLDDLVLELIAHYKSLGKTQIPLISISPQYPQYLGVTISRKSSLKEGLIINSIKPHSTASLIGLKTMDTIVSINNAAITGLQTYEEATNALEMAFKQATLAKSIRITLIRNNKKLTLQQELQELGKLTIRLQLQS